MGSCTDFVSFWTRLYEPHNEELYTQNIHQNKLSAEQLGQLFLWKNGMALSVAQQASLQDKIIPYLDFISKQKKAKSLDKAQFDDLFKPVSTIWRLFLLHIIRPEEYPVFDMHTYRAYRYISGHRNKDLTKYSVVKEPTYHERYVPLYNEMLATITKANRKELDQAMWAFGKFLSHYPNFFQWQKTRVWV